ncbi:MAG TPA: SLC13 family permease [Chloroflexota bacterium]|nr:SLC13 family permease [Chloroflexota bacterium]
MSLPSEIAANPLFDGLPPVESAKLIAELEPRRYAPGEVIFRVGTPGDGLYLLAEGAVEVRTGPAGQEASIIVLRAPDYFGEQALLTGDPRSTTVIAVGDVLVGRLAKPRFDALLARNPALALHLGRVLSRRLSRARRALSEMRRGFQELAVARLDAAPPEQRDFLTRTAILHELDPALVDALLGTHDAAARLDGLAREGVVVPSEDGATYAYHPLLATFLRTRLRAEVSAAELRALHARAAALLEERGDWAEAAHHYRAAGQPAAAERLLLDVGQRLLRREPAAHGPTVPPAPADGATVRAWLAAVSNGGPPRSAPLLALELAAYRRLDDPAGEQRALESVIAEAPASLSAEALATCYERLGELAAARDDRAAAARYLDLALALEREAVSTRTGEPPPPQTDVRLDGNPGAGRLAFAADRAFGLAMAARRQLGGTMRTRLLGLLVALALGAVFVLLPAPSDLSVEAWTALGLLVVFVPILVLDVVPDFVAALLLVGAWAVLGVVPPRVALGGYASGTWVLVLAVLGLGAAVARSGLLYRATLLALTHLPATHVVQGLALAALGLLFTPAMPNATARVAMAAPLTAEMADALGYAPGGPARAGMALATLYGFGLSAGLFLTGSTTGLLVQGVLPPEVRAQFTWGTWLVAALPLHVVILAVGLAAALWTYRPRAPRPLARERLALQWKLLGPPSRAERVTLVIFVLVLGGFVTQGVHHVDPAWVGLAGLCALLATGALDQPTFRSGVNWSFLLYLGVLVGLGDVFVHLGLDTWLANHLADALAPVAGSPLQFALALTLASFALSFVVRWQAAAVLLTLVLAPAAVALGVSPWVVGIIALVATNTWFLSYQSTIYLALYYGMDESFTHASVRPVAWAYALSVLVGVALSVPYWRALGLLG